MQRINIFIRIILFVLISNIVYGQTNTVDHQSNHSIDHVLNFNTPYYTLFTTPRTPLNTSFYNNSMWEYDWFRKNGFNQKELSLFGTGKEIKTSGKTVVYDASMTTLPKTSDASGGDKIIVKNNFIHLSAANNNLFIPIEYIGDNSVKPQSISREEKKEIANYVKKALNISGVTPSSVSINVKNNDFNIVIYKSKYTKEDAIVQSFKVRSRINEKKKTEGIADIERLIDNAELSDAVSKLDALKKEFPYNSELDALTKKIEVSHEIANYNQNYKNIKVLYFEDNGGSLNIYNGIKEKGKSSVFGLSPAINYINTNLSNEVDEMYIIVKSSSSKKEEGILRSIRTQIKSKRPNLRVEAAPSDAKMREVFFYGKVTAKIKSKEVVSHKHNQEYKVNTGEKQYKIKVGVEVKPIIVFKQARKMIKTFYQYFDNHFNSKRTLCSLVNNSRKQVKANFPKITDEDFNTQINRWIKEQFGNTHIVFIEIMEETLENERN